mgnify:CR=1 FL=1
MRLHRSVAAVFLLVMAGCSTTSSYEGADFSASSQCRMQCQADYRSCMARGSTGNSAFSCEQQAVPAPDKRGKDVANPELRRACGL